MSKENIGKFVNSLQKGDNTQAADDLKNAGVDVSKDVAVNADGEGAKISQISQEEMQQSSQDKVPEARPEWLPEKFKNAEELAKAYGELEKSFSSRKQTQEQPKDLSIQDVRKAAEGQEALGKFYDEYAQNNSLSDKSYEELATKHNLSRELVDGYIEGQKALTTNQTQAIYNEVGGQEKYGKVIEWATNNLEQTEVEAFNSVMDKGNTAEMKLAIQGLNARYMKSEDT